MQGRANDGVVNEHATPDAEQAVIWCGKCGIPYAATMTHCSLCGAPLAEDPDPFAVAANAPRTPTPTEAPGEQPTTVAALLPPTDDGAALAAAKIEAHLLPMPALPAATSGRLIGRRRQRQHAMSEDEVDAAAAAIIARARAEENLIDNNPQVREVLGRSPAYLPDPKFEAALVKRQERDRVWLIAGFICCVALILVALVISRYTSTGLLAR